MSDSDQRPLAGGIQQVHGSANDLQYEDLARFAVQEHNKKENSLLEYERVVNVKKQVVSGILYYITLEAKDGDSTKTYDAKIWEKVWLNFKELQEFKLAN